MPMLMTLKVLLPFELFIERHGVSRIVAETPSGSYGLLPQRLDCVTAIAPGILTYETQEEGEMFVAVDEGVMVKNGPLVLISVRHAISGTNLGQLRTAVEQDYLTFDAREIDVRRVMTKLENGFIERFSGLNHG